MRDHKQFVNSSLEAGEVIQEQKRIGERDGQMERRMGDLCHKVMDLINARDTE
jgi:hypothetical protein